MVRHVGRAAAHIEYAQTFPWAHVTIQVGEDGARSGGEPPVIIFLKNVQHRG
jgi:hypothetical protein